MSQISSFSKTLSLTIFLFLVLSFFYPPVAFANTTICQDNSFDLQTCVWKKIPDNQNGFTKDNGHIAFAADKSGSGSPSFFIINNSYASDFAFNFQVQGLKGFHKSAVLRFQNSQNYYLLDLKSSLDNNDSWVILSRFNNGREQILVKERYQNQVNNWYMVETKVVDNHISVTVSDKPLVDFYDSGPILSGTVGFSGGPDPLAETLVWYNHIILSNLTPQYPVIFIPGLGASWNASDMLSCSLDNSNIWTLAPYADMYQKLILTFFQNGYELNKDFFIYGYDWRQNMVTAGKKFKTYLNNILAQNPSEKFNVVSHSLGGLVIRSYLGQNPNDNHINMAISLGAPHYGTVLAYPMWEAGEIWTNDQMQKFASLFLINHCRSILKIGNKDILQSIAPSVRDLLPVFDYLKLNNNLIATKTLNEQNLWLNSNPFDTNGIFITVGGNNISTLKYLDVVQPNAAEKLLGLWPDGKPINNSYASEGDGTILLNSSLEPNALAKTINRTDHSGLIYSDSAIKTIFQYLNRPDISIAVYHPVPEITQIKLNLTGLAREIWKQYILKIRR
ncbi:MAG: alpha/beta fold hydrolase [Patescibacteria group bacterium]|nr:alpha/beta fold hydrolase [Patescibacteria group bacterium]